MRYTCDPAKNKINIARHGIDLNDVEPMFDGGVLELVDNREDYNEERWVAVGLLNGIEITVVYIDDDDLRNLISARRATKDERKDFWKARGG